ncbi:Crossover junction endonuclease eme1 [Colletotrichum tanaceti]|uniref:Crossover junction endonuclease eme1 n=1 Tax=Colletotrichum tanaceti TaxID=1306861 RepID=A0A4U6XF27_9PEZI|nr:Crossover junction endonuclease eme1 [Colletotrichum tanaceti]TKW52547.1 Crossover junction endonuclease eme1 [Colletotrichum tanaceti]
MAAEIISLLSSPSSVGDQPAPPPCRPAQPAVAAATKALTYDDDDVFDLTADSPEFAPQSLPQPGPPKASCSPGTAPLRAKRPREEQAPVTAPVYFNSDDFDTTFDLESSLPIDEEVHGGPRNTKRPRLSLPRPRSGSTTSTNQPHSLAYQPGHPPVKQSDGLRRVRTLADPIEFSSPPGIASRPTTIARLAIEGIESDDPFAALPPSAQPAPSKESPPRVAPTAVAPIEYDLSSDDPFASSPRAPPKPASEPGPIVLDVDDDDDDDDDPFASPPRRVPAETMEFSTIGNTGNVLPKGNRKVASPRRKVNWDPISSSAPEQKTRNDPFDSSPPPPRRTLTKAVSLVIDLSDSDSEPVNAAVDSDEEFPDLDNFDVTKLKARLGTKTTVSRSSSKTAPKPAAAKSTAARATAKRSTDDKARDKEAKATERERERERKRQEKEAAKEEKAKEKERTAALAEVNKIRTDKKVSTPEMIADIPSSLAAAVTLQIQTLLKDLNVQCNTWDSPVGNVVKWRRKVASRFNDEHNRWEPIPMRIEPDKFALAVVTADEFVTYALGPEGSDLEAHVLKMKRHFPKEQLIYLIEGLHPWMRKNRNVRNRQFASAVRNQGDEADADDTSTTTSAPSRRKKNKQPQEYIDEDSIEDALLQLQVMHGVLIHHTNAAVETAQWVAIFTQHISTVPYRKQREATNAAGAGFCMETGQVRTGEDVKDTYVRMLQEIVRVTHPIAYGVVSEFGTVPELVRAFEERGPLCLENCRKSTNRDGGFSDRAVGKAVSKRICKVFTGRDEWSTDV